MSIANKVAIVTGASQGIGAGLVKAFRDRGYRVIANSRSIKPSNDPDILTVAGDIGDRAVAERIVREGVARFGRIDTLVNNAGMDARAIEAGRRFGAEFNYQIQTRTPNTVAAHATNWTQVFRRRRRTRQLFSRW